MSSFKSNFTVIKFNSILNDSRARGTGRFRAPWRHTCPPRATDLSPERSRLCRTRDVPI